MIVLTAAGFPRPIRLLALSVLPKAGGPGKTSLDAIRRVRDLRELASESREFPHSRAVPSARTTPGFQAVAGNSS